MLPLSMILEIPQKSTLQFAVSDVGKALADILDNPVKQYGKKYKFVAPAYSLIDFAAAFTKALGKPVTHTQVSYEDAKKAFMGMGFPEWQVDGIMELCQYIDNEDPLTNESTQIGDIEAITGEAPQSIESWVENNAAGFLPVDRNE